MIELIKPMQMGIYQIGVTKIRFDIKLVHGNDMSVILIIKQSNSKVSCVD